MYEEKENNTQTEFDFSVKEETVDYEKSEKESAKEIIINPEMKNLILYPVGLLAS